VKFQARLQPDPTGAGTFIEVPNNVATALGLRGRPKVQAVIAGHPYRGSLMSTPEGVFCLGVLKAIQQSAGVRRGDTITVELEIDTAPRVIEPPPDLARALSRDRKATAAWDRLSYTHKREIAMSLEAAKKSETRERRLAAALKELHH
jgi:hypothetical protein